MVNTPHQLNSMLNVFSEILGLANKQKTKHKNKTKQKQKTNRKQNKNKNKMKKKMKKKVKKKEEKNRYSIFQKLSREVVS